MNTRAAIALLVLFACGGEPAPSPAPAPDLSVAPSPGVSARPVPSPPGDAGTPAPASDSSPPPLASCKGAAPPREGLTLWLRPGEGLTMENGRVTSWADQAGGAPALSPSVDQRPTLAVNAIAGKPALRFEGGRQALQRTTPIEGLRGTTIAFVNATPTLWKDEQNEWCHHRDCDPAAGAGPRVTSETGCSGTYQHVLWWNGVGDWTGVYLSPKQEEVAFRFGNGTETYSKDPCSVVHDVQVAWSRPASIKSAFSLTVAVHDELVNRLYVDGQETLAIPVPGGKEPTIRASDRLDIGNGFGWVEGTNRGGEIAEVLVYRRALPVGERRALESYLQCSLFPEKAQAAAAVFVATAATAHADSAPRILLVRPRRRRRAGRCSSPRARWRRSGSRARQCARARIPAALLQRGRNAPTPQPGSAYIAGGALDRLAGVSAALAFVH